MCGSYVCNRGTFQNVNGSQATALFCVIREKYIYSLFYRTQIPVVLNDETDFTSIFFNIGVAYSFHAVTLGLKKKKKKIFFCVNNAVTARPETKGFVTSTAVALQCNHAEQTAVSYIAVWHLAQRKACFCVSACLFSPHCEPCTAKDCVIAFPANVCKSAWAGARAPSEARD